MRTTEKQKIIPLGMKRLVENQYSHRGRIPIGMHPANNNFSTKRHIPNGM